MSDANEDDEPQRAPCPICGNLYVLVHRDGPHKNQEWCDCGRMGVNPGIRLTEGVAQTRNWRVRKRGRR